MVLLLGRWDLQDIREAKDNINVIVETDQRIIKEYFDKSELYNYQTYVVEAYHLLGYQGYFGLRRNKNADKVEVNFMEGQTIANYKDLISDISDMTDVSIQWLIIRMHYIMGFAVSALIPSSKVTVFKGPQSHRDILLEHYNDSLNHIVPESVKSQLTGNTDKDISLLFNFFWYYYPNDLTGDDAKLIKSTMQHNLNMSRLQSTVR